MYTDFENEVIGRLFGKKKLSTNNWLDLIELRRLKMKPLLNVVTLKKLSLIYDGTMEALDLDVLVRSKPEDFSLETQGVFSYISDKYDYNHPDYKDKRRAIWGLTRNTEWVYGQISYRWNEEQKRWKSYEIFAHRSTPLEIAQISGHELEYLKTIWDRMGIVVEEWRLEAETRLNQINYTLNEFRFWQTIVTRIFKG